MKANKLDGAELDFMVARAEGSGNGANWDSFLQWHYGGSLRYSSEWALGGGIIEREGLAVMPVRLGENMKPVSWVAHYRNVGEVDAPIGEGPTPLIAAMRAFVAHRLRGDRATGGLDRFRNGEPTEGAHP